MRAVFLTVSVAAGLALARAGVCGETALAPGQDWYARIARHWAPAIFQDVERGPDNPLGRYDFLASADFDGDCAGGNNWENADDALRAEFPLRPLVYYAVIETGTHYFITYSLFHPRDWTRMALAQAGSAQGLAAPTHENDLESATLVVLKDRGFGVLRLVGTVCHLDNYCFSAGAGVAAKTWALDFSGGDAVVRHYDQHPCLFVESGGHGIGGIQRALTSATDGPYAFGDRTYDFKGGDGVVYLCADDPAYVPAGEPVFAGGAGDRSHEVSRYQLLPLRDSLWPLRERGGPGEMFAGTFTYQFGRDCASQVLPLLFAAEGQAAGANPPWARDASSDDIEVGVWFLDPARAFKQCLKTWPDGDLPGYHRYVRNDYAAGHVGLEVLLPRAGQQIVPGYPTHILWQVTAGGDDLAGEADVLLSRNGGRTWTTLEITDARGGAGATWDVTGPASQRCVLAVRAPLGCDAALAATGYSTGFSIARADDRAWVRIAEASQRSPRLGTYGQGAYDQEGDCLLALEQLYVGSADAAAGDRGGAELSAAMPWVFSPTSFAWMRLGGAVGPSARAWPVFALDSRGRRLVVYGGVELGAALGTGEAQDDVWLFSLDDLSWRNVDASGGDTRVGAAGAVDPASHTLLVFGGTGGGVARNDLRALALPDQAGDSAGRHAPPAGPIWETLHDGSGQAPAPRCHAAAGYDARTRRLIVHGGLGDSPEAALADVWAFSLDSKRWTLLDDGGGECPSGRWHHAGCLDSTDMPAGPRLVIYGGRNQTTDLSDAWAFDLGTRQWLLLNDGRAAESPGPRTGAIGAVRKPGGQLMVCGGASGGAGDDGPFADVWSMALGGARHIVAEPDAAGDTLPIVGPAVWPNPAREAVNVSFALPEPCRVSLVVYDVRGRVVRTVEEGELRAGGQTLTWTGHDARGRKVSEGLYFCRITADGFTSTLPVVFLR